MKKAKILAVFGILLAMGITACNKGGDEQSQETPVTSEQGGGETSAHTHKFGSWTETKAPTCTEKGSKERVCECGEKETAEVAALGHDFKNGTVTADTSTCSADGKQTIKCARCNETQEVDVKAHHRFGAETKIDKKGDGYVDINKSVCSVDQAIQLRIRALDGTLASGSSIKSGTADGYFKLNSNGNSMSWKFDLAVSGDNTGAIGMIYTRGFMDAWSSNSSKKYGVYSTSSQDTRVEGNFDFTVNGAKVDKSAYMEKTFEELTAGGEDSSAVGDNYSPIALIPVGQVVLNKGDNTLVYKRTGSYNFVISDIVMVVTEFAHEHTAGTAWAGDDNQHWHVCTAPGCPVEGGMKMDAADHTYGDPYDRVEPTCLAKGSYKQKCSVCEHVKTVEIDQLAHDYRTVLEDFAAGEGYIASQTLACTHNCGSATMYKWSALDYDSAKTTAASDKAPKSVASGKAVSFDTSAVQGMGDDHSKKGTHLVYLVKVQKDLANVGLAMLATEAPYRADMFDAMENENSKGYIQNEAGEWVRPDSRYGIKVDGQEYMVAKNNGAIKGAGTTWYQFPGISLTLTAGIHEIEFFKYGGYDVDLYAYALTGLEAAAVHHLGETWVNTDDDVHYKTCTDAECATSSVKWEIAEHEWDDGEVISEASCTSIGSKKFTCKVCGKQKVDETPKLAHKYEAEEAETYAAGEGYIAAKAFNCETCDYSALRWAALDFDATLSSSGIEKNADNVRFKSGSVENKGGTASTGSHLVYKVNVPAAVAKAGLSFKIKNTGGASGVAPVFKTISGDSSLGAIANGDGTFRDATHRYGLKVNGVEYFLGDDSYGNQSSVTGWFDWPVEFPLNAGVNTIDVFAYAGYRSNMYEFQLIGLPHVTPSHRHTLSTNLSYDGVNHWNTCTGEGCPLAAGSHINETAHTFTSGTAVKNSADKDVTPISCSACGVEGLEMNLKDCEGASAIANDGKITVNSTLTWKFKGAKAGKVAFVMCAQLGSGENPFASGYKLKVGSNDPVDASIVGKNLSSYGATASNPVYFPVGEVTIAESDIDENGEVSISFIYASSQNYRHAYKNTVRIIYVA